MWVIVLSTTGKFRYIPLTDPWLKKPKLGPSLPSLTVSFASNGYGTCMSISALPDYLKYT